MTPYRDQRPQMIPERVSAMHSTEPGWYSDPSGNPNLVRWWNGDEWTSRTKPAVVQGFGGGRYARKADRKAEDEQRRKTGWDGFREEGWTSPAFWRNIVLPYGVFVLVALWVLVVAF